MDNRKSRAAEPPSGNNTVPAMRPSIRYPRPGLKKGGRKAHLNSNGRGAYDYLIFSEFSTIVRSSLTGTILTVKFHHPLIRKGLPMSNTTERSGKDKGKVIDFRTRLELGRSTHFDATEGITSREAVEASFDEVSPTE